MGSSTLISGAHTTLRLSGFPTLICVRGRPGSPRFVVTNAFALGPGADERGAAQARHYNQFLGPDAADQAARRVLTTPEAVRQVIEEFSQIGLDEMVFLPQVADLDQVGRLAEIVI